MRKCWPLMSIGDLFVVASTQKKEEEASSPQVRQLIWFLIAHWWSRWWCWLKHPLHQNCWPSSKQTNHPLGGRYQPITREHSQMTSQSASVPFLPKWLSFFFLLCISCWRSNTSSFHLFVLTDALACLTEGKTDWADLDLKFWERQPLYISYSFHLQANTLFKSCSKFTLERMPLWAKTSRYTVMFCCVHCTWSLFWK